MTRSELVEWAAWRVRTSRNVKDAILDLLSEFDRKASEVGEAVRRLPDGGPVLKKFLRDVQNRVKEIT
jgi:hypothetical protein